VPMRYTDQTGEFTFGLSAFSAPASTSTGLYNSSIEMRFWILESGIL